VQLKRGRTAGQQSRVLLSSSLFLLGVFRAHRSGAYVTRVWSNGFAVRAYPAPAAPTPPYLPQTAPQGRHKVGSQRKPHLAREAAIAI
jgi:hypothetical protein